jgi:hypothetical protein
LCDTRGKELAKVVMKRMERIGSVIENLAEIKEAVGMKGMERVGSVIESLAEIKEALGMKRIARVGSDATANDYNTHFNSCHLRTRHAVLDV